MNYKEKTRKLTEIYEQYENEVKEFKAEAVCRAGCSLCCSDVGSVDITTLEGLRIRKWLSGLPKPQRKRIEKLVDKNMREKEKKDITRCPFLQKNDTCMIYEIRPFSCRHLYSVKKCDGNGPSVHKGGYELAKKTVVKLQSLDDTGYSGHISYILHMLSVEKFRTLYTGGGFNPAEIMAFGKSHGIFINSSVAGCKDQG